MLKHATLTLFLSAGAALAHPGHEAAAAQGAAHWFSSPSHWIVLALGILVATEAARRTVRALRARARQAARDAGRGTP
jgi:Spy/CpxP family protein refolding chaperone